MGKEKLQRQAGNSYHNGLGNNIAFTVGDCMRLPDETGTVPRSSWSSEFWEFGQLNERERNLLVYVSWAMWAVSFFSHAKNLPHAIFTKVALSD